MGMMGGGGGAMEMLQCCMVFAAICAVCKCFKSCSFRDCPCVKRFYRLSGQDAFDEFELMVLVHEALFEHKHKSIKTCVQITAGANTVTSDPSSNGVFQQPLHLLIEQGVEEICIELKEGNHVLADLHLNVVKHVLCVAKPENILSMKVKDGDHIHNPRIKLTMVVNTEQDEEKGLLAGAETGSSDIDILVKQQFRKARQEEIATRKVGDHGDLDVSDLDVLKHACTGPLEIFEGLGKSTLVYAGVSGPPHSRRWVLGFWKDQKSCEAKQHGMLEIDLLKVQSVQADPSRHHVFVINCFDEERVRRQITFRRVDRARDVWVQMLHLLVVKAREYGKKVTTVKQASSKKAPSSRASSRGAVSDGSDSARTPARAKTMRS